ncbi:MAG: 1,2-phenylacetyl-CoA epoxidase subunit PaaC [Woeseia sp.]
MDKDEARLNYVLRLGDNALVLGQRLSEIVTRAPELEEELASANFALDYIGQARLFYSYAGELEGKGRSEDDFAFLRDGPEFRNLLLVEQPNGHFGDTVVRQFLFEAFYSLLLEALARCDDARVTEIAARAVKEIHYHLRHVTQWVVRLGGGTDESHDCVQQSLDTLWRYTGELFAGDQVDEAFQCEWNGPRLEDIEVAWNKKVEAVLADATLTRPNAQWMDGGGRTGRHTEHLGYLIAEMQFLQRAYPGAQW